MAVAYEARKALALERECLDRIAECLDGNGVGLLSLFGGVGIDCHAYECSGNESADYLQKVQLDKVDNL